MTISACGKLPFLLDSASPTVVPNLVSSTLAPTPQGKWSILPLNLEEDALSVGEQKGWNFDAPTDGSVLLSLESHIDWERLAGNAFIMELVVNDLPITSELLINKPIKFTFADGRDDIYYRKSGPNSQFAYWALFYSPSYEANNVLGSGYQVLEGQACLYVFDITSLVKLGQVNKIILSNHGEQPRNELNQPIPLKFRQVKLLQKSSNGN